MLKFRSMRPDAEAATGAVWAQQNDPRTTRVGRFLRESRLDELPQLWNIIRGDMSLIGPRAERPEFDATLANQIKFYRERYLIKPGLSGWAQINYPYGSSVQDAIQKLQYDLYYIKHRSPLLDLQILLKTVNISLRRAGR
jgi:lipopolysaccharide/colanic/teichoic acid biosynthesis glycosyltransferase